MRLVSLRTLQLSRCTGTTSAKNFCGATGHSKEASTKSTEVAFFRGCSTLCSEYSCQSIRGGSLAPLLELEIVLCNSISCLKLEHVQV